MAAVISVGVAHTAASTLAAIGLRIRELRRGPGMTCRRSPRLRTPVIPMLSLVGVGDLIADSSRRPHWFWNRGKKKVRTLWFNFKGD
jgi:hypothetical protein